MVLQGNNRPKSYSRFPSPSVSEQEGGTAPLFHQFLQEAPAAPDPAPAAAPAPVPVSPDPAQAAGPAAPGAPAADMGSVLAAIHTMGSNIVSALQRAQIGGTSLTPADPATMLDAITAAIIDPPKKEG